MSDNGTALVILLTCALAASVAAWRLRWPRPWTALMAVLTVGAASWVATIGPFPPFTRADALAVATLAALLAVLGGGPLTVEVFALVDGPSSGGRRVEGLRRAGEVLRGGAWIGSLERAAVAIAVLSGWPEGIALALAVKGLGRYPELRNQEHTGTAERFLIGTFTSVLWAIGCASLGRWASGG